MECTPRHNTVDCPTLFWAAMPGNEADFPAEESYYTFIEQAVCFFTGETNYRSSLSPFGIKMVDRLTGKPLHLDISDLPMKRGTITNRNKFILGPSGSGKSFFTNHLTRQYYEQGTHIVLIDTGNSYQGLCEMIRRKTGGKDGIYFTYTDETPIAFNPFYTDDKVFDIEKRESIKTLLLTLWKKDTEPATRAEEVALSNAVSLYIERIKRDNSVEPSFNTFYEFVKTDYRAVLDAISALRDPELSPQEQTLACLEILYPDWKRLPDLSAAAQAAMVFINCGKSVEAAVPKPALVDWDTDAAIMAPAVDKVLGYSCRRCTYLHWWEFIGAFGCIGDGQFAQVVSIRNKRLHGKKLDKAEQEFVRNNPDLVTLPKHKLTSAEEEFFKSLGV